MKLVTLETGGVRHIGALLPGELEAVDFTASNTALYFRDMLALIDGGAAALDHARSLLASPPRVTPLTQARLLEPLPEPRQMRDCLVFVARKRSRAARDARRKADALQSGQDRGEIIGRVGRDQS